MSTPGELSFDEILKFMLAHNGKVTNHELVKHFKVFLMNPDMRDEARSTFKKHVNTLANIKNHNNEKWLILKKKYMPNVSKENQEQTDTKTMDSPSTPNTPSAMIPDNVDMPKSPPYRPPPPIQLNQDFNILNNILQDSGNSVAYNTPELPKSTSEENFSTALKGESPPKVHPRRKSASEKSINEKKSNIPGTQGQRPSLSNQDIPMEETMTTSLTSSQSESMLVDNDQKISVKERKQMFNRMASESDVLKSNKLGGNFNQSVDEEDRASLDQKGDVDPLDSKQKQWILCAARGDYHALAKMCKENSKLVKTKDPFTGYTAMHWACKRGDENLVKMLAGVTRQVVNERSNGGYTPLHIAMQFRHETVYNLLIGTYNADPNVRDWSGKKPRQYLVHMDTSLSPGSFRKKESFLRIGSLNVRVKKTTEAFSNFLGVGATRSSAYMPKRDRDADRRSDDGDQLHKNWGSADNIQKDDKIMPPPMSGKVKRRGATGRKGLAAHSRSTPSTPDQPRAHIGASEEGDSDSDSAAGFHAAWRSQRTSCS